MEAAISKTDIGHIKNIVLGLSQSGIQLSKYSFFFFYKYGLTLFFYYYFFIVVDFVIHWYVKQHRIVFNVLISSFMQKRLVNIGLL